MRVAEQRTSACTGLKLAIAVNYGGRWDIVDTARRLAIDVQQGKLQPEDITVNRFSSMISLADCGEPDLLIRTGGETRISNYLLWQRPTPSSTSAMCCGRISMGKGSIQRSQPTVNASAVSAKPASR